MLRGTDSAVERGVELLRTYRYLAVIVAAAAVLRVYRLGVKPLWADEAVYAFASQQLLRTASLVPYYPASDTVITGHPPLTFYILGLIQWFGTSELIVRLPSAVFGIATVLVVYRIGVEIYDRRTGLLAALFLAVSPVHLLYSREALPVAAALFFLSISVYYFLQRDGDHRARDTVAAVGAGAAAFLSHFMSLSLVFFLLPLTFLSDGKLWVKRAAKAVLPLTIFGVILAFWSLNFSVPPKTGNPFFHAFAAGNSIVDVVVTVSRLVIRWVSLAVTTPLAAYVSFWQEVLGFYFGRVAAYLTVPLFLLPAADIVRTRQFGEDGRKTAVLYLWFAGIFFLLCVMIFSLYYELGLSPVRGHPFLVLPFVLLTAKGASMLWRYDDRRLLIVPAVFVLVSLTHALPVAAATPLYLDTIDSPVSQFSNDTYFEIEVRNVEGRLRPGGGIWFNANYTPSDYYTFKQTDTIICGDNPVGAWLVCYPNHPVGYGDSIDWRAATGFTVSRADPGATVYVSVAGPFLYYRGTGETSNVHDLRCNVDHRSCNLTEDFTADGVVWVVADDERYQWQLNSDEKQYLTENCQRWTEGRIQIFRCP